VQEKRSSSRCATLLVEAISQDNMNDDTFHYSLKVCRMCNDNRISLISLQRNEAYRSFFEDKCGLGIQFETEESKRIDMSTSVGA
jgi:hypothetical protein